MKAVLFKVVAAWRHETSGPRRPIACRISLHKMHAPRSKLIGFATRVGLGHCHVGAIFRSCNLNIEMPQSSPPAAPSGTSRPLFGAVFGRGSTGPVPKGAKECAWFGIPQIVGNLCNRKPALFQKSSCALLSQLGL